MTTQDQPTRESIQAAKHAQRRDREQVYQATGLRITEDGQIVPSRYAVGSRLMQFRAGPNEHRFYACADCLPALYAGQAGDGLFFTTEDAPVELVDAGDEIECDLCREG